jgi:hypothetical protein
MRRLVWVVFVVGCGIRPYEWAESERLCADHGGILLVFAGGCGDDSAHCKDGSWFEFNVSGRASAPEAEGPE